jgi:hypothetical protein
MSIIIFKLQRYFKNQFYSKKKVVLNKVVGKRFDRFSRFFIYRTNCKGKFNITNKDALTVFLDFNNRKFII